MNYRAGLQCLTVDNLATAALALSLSAVHGACGAEGRVGLGETIAPDAQCIGEGCEAAEPDAATRQEAFFRQTPCRFSLSSDQIDQSEVLDASYTVVCGDLHVPVRADQPALGMVSLHFARFCAEAACEPTGRSPVLRLPRRPGQSWYEAAVEVSRQEVKELQRRDLWLLEQRGAVSPSSGSSGLLSSDLRCHELDLVDALRADDPMLEADHRLIECKDRLVAAGVPLAALNAVDFAEDIETLRGLMDAERLVLDGSAYGGRVAFEYLRRHGDRVDRLIVDSAPSPQEPAIQSFASSLINVAHQHIASVCRHDGVCDETSVAGSSDGLGALYADLDRPMMLQWRQEDADSRSLRLSSRELALLHHGLAALAPLQVPEFLEILSWLSEVRQDYEALSVQLDGETVRPAQALPFDGFASTLLAEPSADKDIDTALDAVTDALVAALDETASSVAMTEAARADLAFHLRALLPDGDSDAGAHVRVLRLLPAVLNHVVDTLFVPDAAWISSHCADASAGGSDLRRGVPASLWRGLGFIPELATRVCARWPHQDFGPSAPSKYARASAPLPETDTRIHHTPLLAFSGLLDSIVSDNHAQRSVAFADANTTRHYRFEYGGHAIRQRFPCARAVWQEFLGPVDPNFAQLDSADACAPAERLSKTPLPADSTGFAPDAATLASALVDLLSR